MSNNKCSIAIVQGGSVNLNRLKTCKIYVFLNVSYKRESTLCWQWFDGPNPFSGGNQQGRGGGGEEGVSHSHYFK